jgi:heptosyltransferase-2
LARFAGIPIRIGFNRSPANWLYSHIVDYQTTRHEILRNLSLLEPFGVRLKEIIPPEIFPNENDIPAVDELLKTLNISAEKKLVTIAPGSIWPTKRWPESHFSELIHLFYKNQSSICLIGGEQDIKTGEQICKNTAGMVFNFIGKLSLTESAELLRRSSLLVCNDSAPTHLGSAVNVPTISIFGSTVPEFGFGPIAEQHKILQKDLSCRPCTDHGRKKCPIKTLKCLKDISPQDVYHAAGKLIKLNSIRENK